MRNLFVFLVRFGRDFSTKYGHVDEDPRCFQIVHRVQFSFKFYNVMFMQIPVEDTPVGRFLTKTSELGLLHRRAIATRIRFALASKGLRIADGFAAMDRKR